MPETFDLDDRFDDLVRDVSRAAGAGDPEGPVRRSRRRRAVAGAVATAVVVAVGATALTVVGPDRHDPDVTGVHAEDSPGAERRARLLALLPPGSHQVSVVDVVGFTGRPGLDAVADPSEQALFDYLLSPFLKLQRGPFERLLMPDLVTYAGSGATDVFLVDRRPAEIVDRLVRAGWVARDDFLVPGSRVGGVTASLGRYIRVTEEEGQALVVIAHDRGDLLDPEAAATEPVPAAAPLVALGGAVGVSVDFDSSCTLQAFTLSSETAGLVLLGPPAGTEPSDVTVDDLLVPDGISSVDAVSPQGDSVVAQVTVPGPGGPMEVLSRLGLPGTEFC